MSSTSGYFETRLLLIAHHPTYKRGEVQCQALVAMKVSKKKVVAVKSTDNTTTTINNTKEAKALVRKQKQRLEVEKWKLSRVLERSLNKRDLRLVEKLYFINDTSTKYVSVAVYPLRHFKPWIEIGKTCGSRIFLNSSAWQILLDYLKTDMNDHLNVGIAMKIITCFNVKYLCITSMTVSVRLTMDEVDNLRQVSNCVSTLLAKYEKNQPLIQTFCKSFKRDVINSVDPTASPTLFTMLGEEMKMYPDIIRT